MILYDFELERPDTWDGAAALLRDSEVQARLLAGGTDLLPNMRVQILKPALLISLGAIEPVPPQTMADGSIRLDALSRLADLEASELMRQKLPMLAESAHAVAGNQIRQMATLGGNLCQETRCLYLNQEHDYQFSAPCYKRGGNCCYPFPNNGPDTCWSVYMSDVAPALIALNADIEIFSQSGMRRIPVGNLFTGDALNSMTLAPGEMIRAVYVPPRKAGFRWGYHKSTIRGGLEYAIANMAVSLNLEADGKTCAEARIVVGAVSEGPLRAAATERSLVGDVLDTTRLARAADDASKEISPLPHHGFTKKYLRDNVRVHLRRTLAAALERGGL